MSTFKKLYLSTLTIAALCSQTNAAQPDPLTVVEAVDHYLHAAVWGEHNPDFGDKAKVTDEINKNEGLLDVRSQGKSPLGDAIEESDKYLVEILLKAGAKTQTPSMNQHLPPLSPLCLALMIRDAAPNNEGARAIVELLKQYGAQTTRDDIKAAKKGFLTFTSDQLIETIFQCMPFHLRYRSELIIGGALVAASAAAYVAYKKFFSPEKDKPLEDVSEPQPAQ